MNARLTLFIYNLLFPFALLFMLPNLLMRMMRRGSYRHKFAQRFAIYDPEVQARLNTGGRIWIHSISVGETFLALKLARKMKELDPSLKLVVSVTTSTGFALADKSAADWLEVIYNPLDALPFVQRAFAILRPGQLIFIEAMWPNALLGAKKRGIPVAIIPRLSERSGRRFQKFRFVTGGFFGTFDCLCAQEPEDVSRLEAVGADPAKIHVTGGIKFDYADDPAASRESELRAVLRSLNIGDTAPILLAGSTFPGEETTLAQLFIELRKTFPVLFLILVPRHVERTPQILEELRPLGLAITLRTKPGTAKPDCLIVDTTGELRDWYHAGSVIFIGKSLTSYGGQNPAEAAAAGKPVIFGPHMENFKNLSRMLVEHRAAVQVSDADGLKNEIARLLMDGNLREKMGERAQTALLSHQGATGRAAALLLQQAHRNSARILKKVAPHSARKIYLQTPSPLNDIERLVFFVNDPIVQRLGHRPFTAVTRVRIPLGSPLCKMPSPNRPRRTGGRDQWAGVEVVMTILSSSLARAYTSIDTIQQSAKMPMMRYPRLPKLSFREPMKSQNDPEKANWSPTNPSVSMPPTSRATSTETEVTVIL